MAGKLFTLLRPLDIFALVPLMTFASAPKIYSRLSMTLSLVTLAFIIFLIVYLAVALFERKNPTFFQYTLPSTTTDAKLMYGPHTFPIKVSKKIGTLVYGTDYTIEAYLQNDEPHQQIDFDV